MGQDHAAFPFPREPIPANTHMRAETTDPHQLHQSVSAGHDERVEALKARGYGHLCVDKSLLVVADASLPDGARRVSRSRRLGRAQAIDPAVEGRFDIEVTTRGIRISPRHRRLHETECVRP